MGVVDHVLGAAFGAVLFIATVVLLRWSVWRRLRRERERAFAFLRFGADAPQINGCPCCGFISVFWGHPLAAPWSAAPADSGWWTSSVEGDRPAMHCPRCTVLLTDPCAVGFCGRCSQNLQLFANPYGAVARCGPCRLLDDQGR